MNETSAVSFTTLTIDRTSTLAARWSSKKWSTSGGRSPNSTSFRIVPPWATCSGEGWCRTRAGAIVIPRERSHQARWFPFASTYRPACSRTIIRLGSGPTVNVIWPFAWSMRGPKNRSELFIEQTVTVVAVCIHVIVAGGTTSTGRHLRRISSSPGAAVEPSPWTPIAASASTQCWKTIRRPSSTILTSYPWNRANTGLERSCRRWGAALVGMLAMRGGV